MINEWKKGVVERYDKEATTMMEDKNSKTRHLLDDIKEKNFYVRWKYHMIVERHNLNILPEESVLFGYLT